MRRVAAIAADPVAYARSLYRVYLRRRPEDRLLRAWSRRAYRHGDETRWLGVRLGKLPQDLWIYQELIAETRPQVLVETGTAFGGSALFFASLFDLLGEGRVVSVDLDLRGDVPQHQRIEYIQGSSVAPDVLDRVRQSVAGADRVMVVLDSDHAADHVRQELHAYGPLVTVGCYVVVEDSYVHGRPLMPGFGPGPGDAVDDFLRESDAFVADRTRERFGVTLNPGGWLRRIR
jgi:cephalosporin hydroxylase